MANPQIEKGYIKISNEIYDALCKIRIPGEPRQLFDFIIRKTYGFNRKEALLTLDEFRITGISDKGNISRGLKKLQKMGVIIVTKRDNKSDCFYSIQKDYDLWEPLAKKPKTIGKKADEPLSKLTKSFVKIDNVVKNDNEFIVRLNNENSYDFENQKKPEGNEFSEEGESFVKIDKNLCQIRQKPLSKLTTTINKIQLKDKLKTLGDILISNPNKGKVGTGKRKYLSFVYLSDEEYLKLCEAFGEDETLRRIQNLDDYIAMKGVKYKDHYRVILVWHRKDEEKRKKEMQSGGKKRLPDWM